MTLKGTLRYVDIGAGGWKLECADGSVYNLYGTIPPELANTTVIVTGKESEGFGFLMNSSKSFEVESISPA